MTDQSVTGTATLENGTTVVFTPDAGFVDGFTYTFTLGAGLADLSGNEREEKFVLHFQTVAPTCPPEVCKSGIYRWETESCGYEPLENGTSCRNDNGTCNEVGECVCHNEFMTADCLACQEGTIDFPACRDDPCAPDPCNSHGTCDQADGSCTCDNEFMTSDCGDCQEGRIDYPDCRDDPCEPDPCNSHGTCDSADGSCECDNEYMTVDCGACQEGRIDYPNCRDNPCDPDPCNDHGTCDQADGSCTCDNAFMTADCSACQEGAIDFPDCRDDPCEPDPCNNHGTCDQADGSCECDNAFMTADCGDCQSGTIEYPTCRDDPCDPDPCNGHGTCDSADGSCECDNEFMTVDCGACQGGTIDYPNCRDNPCEPDPCNQYSTCDTADGSCTCNNAFMTEDCLACREGYLDFPDCRDDPCEPDPCNNHGTCDQADGSCECDNAFMTSDCGACQEGTIEYPTCRDDPCEPDPCHDHGTCDSQDGSCDCNTGYDGSGCGVCAEGYLEYPTCRDDPCDPDPCHSHGTCNQANGSCTCDNEFMTSDCGDCQEGFSGYPECHTEGFVAIQAGTFWMGSPDGDCPAGYPASCTSEMGRPTGASAREKLHRVTLTYDFELQAHEVTQGEWFAAFGDNPSYYGPNGDKPDCGDNCPVERVNWYEVLVYANWLSTEHGLTPCYTLTSCSGTFGSGCESSESRCFSGANLYICTVALNGVGKPQDCEGYRLPTEAEWEYAIRAGNQYTAFYLSDGNDGTITSTTSDPNMDQIGWYRYNVDPYGTRPVGGKEANAWGLYDMSGNVSELVWDRFQYAYETDVGTDPVGPSTGSSQVKRGGSVNYSAQDCRSAYRTNGAPYSRYSTDGFRLCRTIP